MDTVWILMDPAVFDRLTRQRHWTLQQYQRWFASSVDRLLLGDTSSPIPNAIARRRSTRQRDTRPRSIRRAARSGTCSCRR